MALGHCCHVQPVRKIWQHVYQHSVMKKFALLVLYADPSIPVKSEAYFGLDSVTWGNEQRKCGVHSSNVEDYRVSNRKYTKKWVY